MVGHFPAQPQCFAYGGFDIQMNRVIDLLAASDVSVGRINPWDRDVSFDIAHFWGGDESHAIALRFCKERGIKTVVSVLLPNRSRGIGFIRMRIRTLLRNLIKGRLWFSSADIITVINEDQAFVANKILGIDLGRILIAPTILDDAFFSTDDADAGLGQKGYALCVGTIGRRKNQLNLLRAAKHLGLSVILCGEYDDSDKSYEKAVEQEIAESEGRFSRFSGLSGVELCNLYRGAKVVACVSHHETEPASILEGMILKKPIIAADRPYATNVKFDGIFKCAPDCIDSIVLALAQSSEKQEILYPNFNSAEQAAESVISVYKEIYQQLRLNFKGVCK